MNFYESNHFDTQRNEFQQETTNKALDKKLEQLFTPKTYFERWRHFNTSAMVLSYVCNFLSSVTAFTILSFLFYSSFNGVFPVAAVIPLSVLLSLLVVAIMEAMKRFSTANFLRGIFQEKKTNSLLLGLVLFCCGCSVITSFYGAKNIPNLTRKQPVEVQPNITNKDSIKAFYSGLLATKQKTINNYLPSIKMSGTARKTVAKLESEITSLHLKMETALNQASKKDSQNVVATKTINRQAVENFKAAQTSEGYNLTLIALSFELVFLLCLIFNWLFYWNCYIERASTGGNQQAIDKQEKQPQQKQQPQQRPTIVQGFLQGLQPQKKDITSAVNTEAVKYTRHCGYCSAPFMHKVHNQKFCKEKCRISAWEKKVGKKLKKKQKSYKTT